MRATYPEDVLLNGHGLREALCARFMNHWRARDRVREAKNNFEIDTLL
jgi:hypothetical protein